MKIIKLILIISILTVQIQQISLARSYPIKIVQKNHCDPKIQNNCSIFLPIIKNADYQKYRYNPIYREIYTMLQGTTYFDGRDQGLGSHPWIDIATQEGTPIYAVHAGKVILTQNKGERGQVITIQHEQNGQIFYSSYAHLQKILVEVGDEINEWKLIWLVGNTGNSTWPHLHFQIENKSNGEHPFFFKNCPGTITEIVNEWRCQNQMYEHTLDPILFLESKGTIALSQATTTINEYNKNFRLSGFQGGILSLNDLTSTIIYKNPNDEKANKYTIQYNEEYINIFPKEFELIGDQRRIYLNPQKTGFTTIKVSNDQGKEKNIFVHINWNNQTSNTQNTFSLPHFRDPNSWITIILTNQIPKTDENIFITSSTDNQILKIRNGKENLGTRLKDASTTQSKQIISLSSTQLNQRFLLIHAKTNHNEPKELSLFTKNNFLGIRKITPKN